MKSLNVLMTSPIRYQLFVMVGAGIVIMLAALTLSSTWIANHQVRQILLHEGLEHTANLAENSTLSLLYSSPENADSAIRATLAFSGVEALAIYNDKLDQFTFAGKDILPKHLNITEVITEEAIIFYEDKNNWHFLSPVRMKEQEDAIEKQLFKKQEGKMTIGYAYIVLNKSTLDNIESGIFRNNISIALFVSIFLLFILRLIIRRLTQPLKNISEVMRETEKGQFAIHINTYGPQEVQHIANAYNRMVKAIAERDSELRMHNIHLEKQATRDHLTGLINRTGFEQALTIALDECRKLNTSHVLCYMDLDKFKIVNDACGHSAGDELLKEISELFKEYIRKESDTLARVGGDEFALILKSCTIKKAKNISETICKAVESYRFIWNDKQFSIGVSIGVVPLDENAGTIKNVISKADSACYIAKERGRGQVHVIESDGEADEEYAKQTHVSNLVIDCIENDRFELYYQVITPLKTVGTKKNYYEILLRIPDGNGNHISSNVFIESAERYNLSTKIDQWVIDKVFSLVSQENGLFSEIDLCTINITGSSINNKDFIDYIRSKISKFRVDPGKICFEITESSTISSLKNARLFIDEMHEIGCLFSIDNFGSGSLSFEYLKQLNADILKIDGVLVKSICDDPVSHAMVKSINEIGHILNMKTVAGSVESNVILEFINDLGFDYAQGYVIGKPSPLDDEK